MKKLRVAVIGTGMIANAAHFPILNILREEGLIDKVGHQIRIINPQKMTNLITEEQKIDY